MDSLTQLGLGLLSIIFAMVTGIFFGIVWLAIIILAHAAFIWPLLAAPKQQPVYQTIGRLAVGFVGLWLVVQFSNLLIRLGLPNIFY
ncbi:MAG: hypothetical protein AAGI12_15520 [Pseudomonadota bacterium]